MASEPGAASSSIQSQRVRVGMIGLAAVFLLVMLATAMLSLGRDAGTIPDNQAAANALADTPREPLAELGVAPGNPAPATAAAAKPAAR